MFFILLCVGGGGGSERDRKKINKLIKRASSVLSSPLETVEQAGERRMLHKLTAIMGNPSHPLHGTVSGLKSSRSNRLRHPQCKTERFRRSFIPMSGGLFNSSI